MEIPYTVSARPDTGLWNAKIGVWLFLASEVMLFGGLFSAYIFLRMGATEAAPWPHGLLNVWMGFFNTLVLIASSVTMVMAWASLKMRKFHMYKIYLGITVGCGVIFMIVKGFEYAEKFNHYGVTLVTDEQITGHLKEATDEYLLIVPDPNIQVGSSYMELRWFEEVHRQHLGADRRFTPEQIQAAHDAYEPLRIERADIRRMGYFVPGYSSYFAIYFTLTGLHALHVLGGMCVNTYLLFPGSKLYRTNPEHLANRVEVSGLFWHFVDLVWIFLFPILYLL